jgi:hypothetical protein
MLTARIKRAMELLRYVRAVPSSIFHLFNLYFKISGLNHRIISEYIWEDLEGGSGGYI